MNLYEPFRPATKKIQPKEKWRNQYFEIGEIVMTEHFGKGKVIEIGKYEDSLDIQLSNSRKVAYQYPAYSTSKIKGGRGTNETLGSI